MNENITKIDTLVKAAEAAEWAIHDRSRHSILVSIAAGETRWWNGYDWTNDAMALAIALGLAIYTESFDDNGDWAKVLCVMPSVRHINYDGLFNVRKPHSNDPMQTLRSAIIEAAVKIWELKNSQAAE